MALLALSSSTASLRRVEIIHMTMTAAIPMMAMKFSSIK
jgi:hypothetical protein